ncbi:tail fiber protein, partial [Lysinibacillus sphaericus]|uniref:tail fiber protein n=2 Tax=Lysinibacillus TaxID=400634 RepID=UPI000AFE4A88
FNGSTFIALQDNLGKTPPTLPTQSNAYWSLFAEKGATGNTGLQGPPGKDGTGVTIIGSLPSETDLPPVGAPGDAYMIEGNLYVWQDNTKTWKNVGPIQGPEGKSAYDLAVKNGFQGTMEEWIESLKGEQGPPGPMGPPGPPADLTEINQQVSTLQTEVNEHVTGIATNEKLGHIRPDGTTFTVDPVTGVASSLVTNEVKPFSGNLNDLTKTGLYEVPSFTANTPSNSPGIVEVLTSLDNKIVVQKFLTLSNNNNAAILRRTGYSATGQAPYNFSVVSGAGQINGWINDTIRLTDSVTSDSDFTAPTAKALKQVNDKISASPLVLTPDAPFVKSNGASSDFTIQKIGNTTTISFVIKNNQQLNTTTTYFITTSIPSGFQPTRSGVVGFGYCSVSGKFYTLSIIVSSGAMFLHGLPVIIPVDTTIQGMVTYYAN